MKLNINLEDITIFSDYSDSTSVSESNNSIIDSSPTSEQSYFIESEHNSPINGQLDNSSSQRLTVYVNRNALSKETLDIPKILKIPLDKLYSNEDNTRENYELTNNYDHAASIGTVSTSILLNKTTSTDSRIQDIATPGNIRPLDAQLRRTSSFYSPAPTPIPNSTINNKCTKLDDYVQSNIQKPKSIHSRFSVSLSPSAYIYDDTTEPDIEEAAKLLRTEMSRSNSKASYIPPKLGTESTFVPQKYHLKITSETSKPRHLSGSGLHSSLLNNILIPVTEESNAENNNLIPYVIGRDIISTTGNIPLTPNHPTQLSLNTNIHSSVPTISNTMETPMNIPSSLTKSSFNENEFAESQFEMILNSIEHYHQGTYKNPHLGIEDTGHLFMVDSQMYKDNDQVQPNSPLHIQHIDSKSFFSFDSEATGFFQVYSLWRLLLLLCCCILVPPMFFLIGFGNENKNLISNYRITRMVLKSNQRFALLEGFDWNIDISWLRSTSFVLGLIETTALMACIAVAFGVDITNQH